MKQLVAVIVFAGAALTACGGDGSVSSFARIADMQEVLDAKGMPCEGDPTVPNPEYSLWDGMDPDEELECEIDDVGLMLQVWEDGETTDRALELLRPMLKMFCAMAGSDAPDVVSLGRGVDWVVSVSGDAGWDEANATVDKVTRALGGKVHRIDCA